MICKEGSVKVSKNDYGMPGVTNASVLWHHVLKNNDAFLNVLVSNLSMREVRNFFNVRNHDFFIAVCENPQFWYLFLKNKMPIRLLIIHAIAAQSNNVGILTRRADVDYKQYGLKVLHGPNWIEWRVPKEEDVILETLAFDTNRDETFHGDITCPQIITCDSISKAYHDDFFSDKLITDTEKETARCTWLGFYSDESDELPSWYSKQYYSGSAKFFWKLDFYKLPWYLHHITTEIEYTRDESESESESDSE